MYTSIYSFGGPTEWAQPPSAYSFSSLSGIKRCPRQWQLSRSRYGDREGFPSRPSLAAVEGTIVHETLDQLRRELLAFGSPEMGCALFREVVGAFDIRGRISEVVAAHDELLRDHPRARGVGRWRRSVQELANQVVRLFRQSYLAEEASTASRTKAAGARPMDNVLSPCEALERLGVLTEVKISHPYIPFTGVIDLMRMENGRAVVADFKSGERREEHRTQVLLYALMWWRQCGQVPARLEIRYLDQMVTTAPEEAELEAIERWLQEEIGGASAALGQTPAAARLGDHCRYCDVRQFCEEYWSATEERQGRTGRGPGSSIDLELTVTGTFEHGIEGVAKSGERATVVHSKALAPVLDECDNGARLRVLGATRSAALDVVELKVWSEVFGPLAPSAHGSAN